MSLSLNYGHRLSFSLKDDGHFVGRMRVSPAIISEGAVIVIVCEGAVIDTVFEGAVIVCHCL